MTANIMIVIKVEPIEDTVSLALGAI